MTEQEFQDVVVDLARLYGWRVAHFAAARTAHGWRTPARYDAKGFPDLVLVHPVRHLIKFVEVKSRDGKTTPEQDGWLSALSMASARTTEVRVQVWRPQDASDIARSLSAGQITEWRI